jgi:hypothetical protein
MIRHPKGRWRLSVGLSFMVAAYLGVGKAEAIFLDKAETLRFNGRVYNRTSYSTQDSHDNTRLRTPYNDWNMLQNRTFIQMEMRHNLTDLIDGRYDGLLSFLQFPLAPLRLLDPDDIDYFVTYRGEYDGVWDYGPDVFSERHVRNSAGDRLNTRQRLRHRHRLFEAYVNYTKGPVFFRIGRQNLSWGETDVFRLLDQINPLDASFGGFLVRVKDHSLRSTWKAMWRLMIESLIPCLPGLHGRRRIRLGSTARPKDRQRISRMRAAAVALLACWAILP